MFRNSERADVPFSRMEFSLLIKKKKKRNNPRVYPDVRNVFESETFFEKSLLKFSTANVCERLERRFVIFTLATCVEDVGNPREGS